MKCVSDHSLTLATRTAMAKCPRPSGVCASGGRVSWFRISVFISKMKEKWENDYLIFTFLLCKFCFEN